MLCRLKAGKKCEEIEIEKTLKRNRVEPRHYSGNFSHYNKRIQKEGAAARISSAVVPNAEELGKTRAFAL